MLDGWERLDEFFSRRPDSRSPSVRSGTGTSRPGANLRHVYSVETGKQHPLFVSARLFSAPPASPSRLFERVDLLAGLGWLGSNGLCRGSIRIERWFDVSQSIVNSGRILKS